MILSDLSDLDAALLPLADPVRAAEMSAYMRDRFPFLGVPAPQRRAASREVLRGRRKAADWEFIDACWARPEREYRYVACDHLRTAAVDRADLDRLRRLVSTGSWWDTVDALAKTVGRTASAADMREWARDPDMWVRRAAILHQLGRRHSTDAQLLGEIVRANLGSGEFFIDKAIGWALRDHSKTDPGWVRAFLGATDVSPLTRREASRFP